MMKQMEMKQGPKVYGWCMVFVYSGALTMVVLLMLGGVPCSDVVH